ncbi:MAG: cytochrome c [Bacteroidota bacterium]
MKLKSITIANLFLVAFISSYFIIPSDELEESKKRGKELYITNCISCHMENGEGIPAVFPPLAKSDYLMEDTKRAARQILNGAAGEMVVNGTTYNGVMSEFDLTDQEVADILNYITNNWGNEGGYVKENLVKEARN